MDGRGSSSAESTDTLRVTLLGGMDLALGERPVAVEAPRLRSLLAYLLLHRVPQPRTHLAYLFWPDSDETQARTNLRQALHLLRRSVPEVDRFLDIDSRMLGLRRDAPWWVDVDAFEDCMTRAGSARGAGTTSEERSALEAAAALYEGDLLPECYDDWLVPVREQLRERFRTVLARLAELLEAERDYREALPWARRWVDADPLNEEACLRLMRLHALSGDRAAALRVYHGCATALVRELGVSPGAAIEEYYTNLLEVEARAEPGEVEPATTVASTLVGRGEEWEALRSAWARVVAGESRMVTILGEAGIGKSHLAEEFGSWVRQQGFTSAASRCYVAAGGLAYAPAVELLRSRAIGPRLRRLEDPWLVELARLMPELIAQRPELRPTAPMIDGWQRARLFDALSHAVLAEERPTLLVIDDLQWCDRETLDWLTYVRASRPQAPLLVVVTARTEELVPDHPAHAVLLAARGDARVTELELRPLRPEETALLAAHVLGRDLGDEREERLHRETEGNPLFVVEWLRAGLVGEPGPAESDVPVPPRALSVLEARLAQLSTASQELAGLASVVGREFTFDLLTRASSLDEEQVVDALDELWRRRIIREQGALAYDFSHDKLREVAYRRESPARSRLLHRRVAQAMERLHGSELDDVSGQLAMHYAKAGWFERAIGFYSRAATVAQRVFANDEVIDLLSHALELLPQESPGQARDTRELGILTTLGVALVIREGYGTPEVVDAYTRAWQCCERLGQPATAPVLRGIGLSSLARGELRQAHDLATQLLELGVAIDDPMIRVEGQYLLGVTSFWLGDLADARERLQEAIAGYVPERARSHLAVYPQDPRVICLSRLAYTLWHLGVSTEATDRSAEALQLAEQLKHPFSMGYALTFASWLAIDMGDEHRARELSERLAVLAEERQLGFLQPIGTILRGRRSVMDGDTAAGMTMIRAGIDLYRRSEQSLYLPWSLRLLAQVCLDQGLLDDARDAITEALEIVEITEQRFLEADLLRLSGELALVTGGDRADAESLFARALEVSRHQGAVRLGDRAADSLARLRGDGG